MSSKSVPCSDDPSILRVQCSGCNAAYKIKQEAIASYPAAFKCKKCGHRIRIDAPAVPEDLDRTPEPAPPAIEQHAESAPPVAVNAAADAIPSNPEAVGADELTMFIGNNADLYLQRFTKFTAHGSSEYLPTWHWPAFFVPWLWFLYRKLYLWSFAAFVTGLVPFLNLVCRVCWGITAHYIYCRHAHNKIRHCKTLSRLQPDISLNQVLSKRGGVHQWVWGFSALPLLGILAAIAIPQFHAYRVRAYDVQGQAAVRQVLNAQQIFFQKNNRYAGSIAQLQDAGLDLHGMPDIVVSLLGSGPTDFYIEGFHSRGDKRFAACAAGDELTILPKEMKEIFGPKRAYKLSAPDDWHAVKDLNDAAEVQIAQSRKDCYLIVLAEKQDDLQIEDLAEYSVLVRSNIQDNLLQAEARKTGLDSINNHDVIQYEIRGALPDSRVPVVYLHTVVRGRQNIYQVIAWTTDRNHEANQSALKSIVNHFQET